MRKNLKGHLITGIEPESIAEEVGIEPGDRLTAINGTAVEDVFDYRYLSEDEEITVSIISCRDGEEYDIDIEKDYNEDLGLIFEGGLMDEYHHCSNKCIFCFIDQMPAGMRDTLYFKDDDARLSFLQGNYITLTNMSEKDVDRICFYKLSPINISIHTTNPELRVRMLNNRFAGEKLKLIKKFMEAGIEINGQIVLCRGVNDGAELERTLRDIEEYLPSLKSISVVPVGLTKYREGLCPLEPFDEAASKEVLEIVDKWQSYYLGKYGSRIVYASDEWFLKSGLDIPGTAYYEGFPQLENGVGMIRSFLDEFEEAFKKEKGELLQGRVTMITGRAFEPVLKNVAKRLHARWPKTDIEVEGITNNFFGEQITVAGLVTGQDIIEQLKGKNLGKYLIVPSTMLRSGERVFLDDVTVEELEKTLQISVRIVKSNGISIIDVLKENYAPADTKEVPYEQTDSCNSRQT